MVKEVFPDDGENSEQGLLMLWDASLHWDAPRQPPSSFTLRFGHAAR
jgi:hypothetical protein